MYGTNMKQKGIITRACDWYFFGHVFLLTV